MSEHSASVPFNPYPQGVLRTLLRFPLLLHRVGLGWVLGQFNIMVLTTRGRSSGAARHTVLEFRRHGSKLYAISVWGTQTHWYRNLLQDPSVTVQIGSSERSAVAAVVDDPAEALRALYMFQRTGAIYEAVIAYMAQSGSGDLRTLKQIAPQFTVVRFDLTDDTPALQGIRPTHRWVLPVLVVLLLALLLVRGSGYERKSADGYGQAN
jgi:deazaflavin-dependent oxidoreductase (nitroreductase family)